MADTILTTTRRAYAMRRLTTAQRAAIAAELATLEHGGDRKSAQIKGSNDPLISDQLSIDQAAELIQSAQMRLWMVMQAEIDRLESHP